MQETLPKLTLRDVLGYLLAYTCWILAILVSMVAIFYARDLFNLIWVFLGGSGQLLRVADKFLLFFGGLVWVIYTLVTEYQYRHSINKARMRRARSHSRGKIEDRKRNEVSRLLRNLGLDLLGCRVLTTLAFPAGLLALSYLSQWLSQVL